MCNETSKNCDRKAAKIELSILKAELRIVYIWKLTTRHSYSKNIARMQKKRQEQNELNGYILENIDEN